MRKETQRAWLRRHQWVALTFVGALVLVGVLNAFFHTNLTVSESENRPLQGWPPLTPTEIFSGRYTQAFDVFLSDQFMFRHHVLEWSRAIEALKGLPSDISVYTVGGDNMANGGEPVPAHERIDEGADEGADERADERIDERADERADEGKATEAPDSDEASAEAEQFQLGTVDYYVYGDRAFSRFVANPEAEKRYAAVIGNFAKAHPHLRVYHMVLPVQSTFVPAPYQKYTDDSAASIDRLRALTVPEVTFISPLERMREKAFDDLYLRTDHHWNGRGAYEGYCAYCEAAGQTPVPLEDMTEIKVPGFLGSFYNMTSHPALKKHPDTIEAFEPIYPITLTRIYVGADGALSYAPPVEGAVSKALMGANPSYGIFIGGDTAITELIRTDEAAHALGNLMVVKDSYGNALVPFLTQGYREVHVIDPRHFRGRIADYAAEHTIDTVLFVNNVNITVRGTFEKILRAVF